MMTLPRFTLKMLIGTGIFAWSALNGVLASDECRLPREDLELVKAVDAEYIAAWRTNDPNRVAALLTEDAVMMPHHGVEPRVGKTAALDWWFPQGEVVAPVFDYRVHVQATHGCGTMAISHGRLERLEYGYQGRRYTVEEGNFLTVFRKGGDEKWRISHRIWNDPVAERE